MLGTTRMFQNIKKDERCSFASNSFLQCWDYKQAQVSFARAVQRHRPLPGHVTQDERTRQGQTVKSVRESPQQQTNISVQVKTHLVNNIEIPFMALFLQCSCVIKKNIYGHLQKKPADKTRHTCSGEPHLWCCSAKICPGNILHTHKRDLCVFTTVIDSNL